MKSMNTDVYNSDILPKNEENSLGGFMKLDHYYKGSFICTIILIIQTPYGFQILSRVLLQLTNRKYY